MAWNRRAGTAQTQGALQVSDRDELIAKAREITRACPDSCTLLPELADLAESEGKRADEAERERAKSDAAYEALFR